MSSLQSCNHSLNKRWDRVLYRMLGRSIVPLFSVFWASALQYS